MSTYEDVQAAIKAIQEFRTALDGAMRPVRPVLALVSAMPELVAALEPLVDIAKTEATLGESIELKERELDRRSAEVRQLELDCRERIGKLTEYERELNEKVQSLQAVHDSEVAELEGKYRVAREALEAAHQMQAAEFEAAERSHNQRLQELSNQEAQARQALNRVQQEARRLVAAAGDAS